MSNRPAFLKGFFGTPNDDPLLQPSEPSRETFDASILEESEDAERDAAPDATPTPPSEQEADVERDSSAGPPSLYARIQNVMDRTAPPDDVTQQGRSHNGRPSSSGDRQEHKLSDHYAPGSSPNPVSESTGVAEVGGDTSPRAKRQMRIRSGSHEEADLQKVNDAVNDGWYVETVRSASENDTLVDVVLRRDSAPSLFDFDVPDE
ncbi:hypothetical protein CRI94_06190 [Longibacter salinarum]|uniref:Uncharacterized protein n=1 Tax=Longibacter salinarum TaxID=1850348 RepID=A0A2A8D1T5_9BACT|nr:hypothetical protein [Longibacter salinarum]PEN14608.1 hypothetical protein CRI94_06190 [Longibacter salinarum]